MTGPAAKPATQASRRVQLSIGVGILLVSLAVIIRTLVILGNGASSGDDAGAVADSTAVRGPVRYTVADTVRAGFPLRQALQRIGVPLPEADRLTTAFDGIFNLRRSLPGHRYTVTVDSADGSVSAFTYFAGLTEQWEGIRKLDGFSFRKKEFPLNRSVTALGGTVETSLWQAMSGAGAKDTLIHAFAAVFDWDIDFLTECRKGDRFRVVFEQYRCRGELVRYGDVLAAEYSGSVGTRTAVLYRDADGNAGYFDPDGNSMRRPFVRSPLDYGRIASGSPLKRYHPVIRRYRPRAGLDFAAPVGTEVRATGDGTVVAAGRDAKELGNYIRIRHARGYVTMYGHLARFAQGIATGAQVRQGQVIGYVGSSGVSAGPRLDYRVRHSGAYVNPLELDLPAASSVPDRSVALFRMHRDRMLEAMEMFPLGG